MTSSLVGSEMCIRDSYRVERLRRKTLNVHPVPPVSAGKQPRTWLKIEPVSYTHLTLPTICSV
eukprot:7598719-Prorocentrum_lima.AAC.1